MWQRLLACTDHHADNEVPQWIQETDVAPKSTQLLLGLAAEQTAPDISIDTSATSAVSKKGLQQQLEALAQDVTLTLNALHWQRRIEQSNVSPRNAGNPLLALNLDVVMYLAQSKTFEGYYYVESHRPIYICC